MQLTEKYRPHNITDVVGQAVAKHSIEGMLKSNNIKPTILITGTHGIGKTTLARIIAGHLNCMNGPGNFCGECISCKSHLKGNHPDLHEINCGADRGIDQIRELISISEASPRYKYRVFILDEFHAVTGPAASAMLKPLEDPPPRTVWIICTTDPQKLLKTIRSRTLEIKLNPVSKDDISKLLTRISNLEGIPINESTINLLAEYSDGHPRDALNLLQNLGYYISNSGRNIENLDEMLPTIMEEFAEIPPYILVEKYVGFLLSGNVEKALQSLRHTNNIPYFVELALSYIKSIVLILGGAHSLVDNKFSSFVNRNVSNFVTSINIKTMISVFEIHQKSLLELKTYSTNHSDSADLMVMKSFCALSTW